MKKINWLGFCDDAIDRNHILWFSRNDVFYIYKVPKDVVDEFDLLWNIISELVEDSTNPKLMELFDRIKFIGKYE